MSTVAVVGAGLTGLTAGLRLACAGYRQLLFERYPRPGGLVRVLTVGGERLEAFYHHLFTSDHDYVRLASELGLSGAIQWLPSRMGIWTAGRLWDFGTPQSLLRFRPLPPVAKLRFALSTLLLQHRSDPEPFEHVRASDWLRRHQGERAWQAVWRPLLVQKFGSQAEEVAMVWLWCKLRLRGTSRSRSGLGERLGYMQGSFDRLVTALETRLRNAGAGLELGEAVRRIERLEPSGGTTIATFGERRPRFRVHTRHARHDVDAVVVAAPVGEYLELAGSLLTPDERERLGQLQSTGALCTVLELDRSLTKYYWLNVADIEMPFGGLIEHTNLVPRERYGGRHVLYISNYMFTGDPLFSAPRATLLDRYLPALARINPRFDRSWVLDVHHFRAESAQPVVTCGYRDLIPGHRSSVPGLYLASMAQIYPEDRGQSYAVAHGEQVARCVIQDLNAASG